MHITVSCPSCYSKYQLEPALIGQRMRCPNPICREVFEVRADLSAPEPPPEIYPFESEKKSSGSTPPAPQKPTASGSISEVVPLLITLPAASCQQLDGRTMAIRQAQTRSRPLKVASWRGTPARNASGREEFHEGLANFSAK